MLTYTSRRNLFGQLTNDKAAANLALGDTLMNTAEKRISKKFSFLEDTQSIPSVASQQFYPLKVNFGRLKSIYVTIGTTRYYPTVLTSRAQWDQVNATSGATSDIPQYAFIANGQINVYPKSATTAGTLTVIFHQRYKDLSVADYTTGTITTISNGAKAVVGNATSWTANMAGRYLFISEGQSGDGQWYKIASVTNATSLTLEKNYEGVSIAAGTSAYIIGQCSIVPEDYQSLSLFQALRVYFTSYKPDAVKRAEYKQLVAEMKEGMMEDYGATTLSPVIVENGGPAININNYPVASE